MKIVLVKLNNGYSYLIEVYNVCYLISPYHVLCNKYLDWGLKSIDAQTFYRADLNLKIECIKGTLNRKLDLVVAKLEESVIPFTSSLVVMDKLEVINPQPSNFIKIYNYTIQNECSINFGKHTQTFEKLIVCNKVSTKGYSGKLITNSCNTLLGMVIADNRSKSFILPITNIINYIKNSF